ncbi:class I SAM-dependent methyltransferase [Uliginosibacterium paludis]|uniref:Class I SAM-dependent methyltransferase n=1 Tax=Uliginosibacterium paludis TaxID=1615952 RepID=A0ABV2CMR9_9RHOO
MKLNSGELRYQASINLAERNNSHTLAFEFLQRHAGGRHLRVLEVGCASGYWGAVVRQHGHHVVGVEPEPAAAENASKLLDSVYCGDLDSYFAAHPETCFDAVSFVDVLEHTPDPAAVIRASLKRLSPGGVIIASVPNVTHLAVRAMLLEGRWEYGRTGILDDSHLRFLCKKSIVSLFSSQGLRIDQLEATKMGCVMLSAHYGLKTSVVSRCVAWLLATDCHWSDFQYVLSASPASAAEQTDSLNQCHLGKSGIWAAWCFKFERLFKSLAHGVKVYGRRILNDGC